MGTSPDWRNLLSRTGSTSGPAGATGEGAGDGDFDIGNVFKLALKGPRAISAKANRDARNESKKWEEEYGKWREDWSHVADLDDETGARTRTGRRYDELAGIYAGDVDRGMYDAGTNTAAIMARRGLSDSGYGAGAQADVISRAAAARAAARERAMSGAISENMQILNGDLVGLGGQAGLALEPYRAAREWAQQQALLQQQKQWQDEQEYMSAMASLPMLMALA